METGTISRDKRKVSDNNDKSNAEILNKKLKETQEIIDDAHNGDVPEGLRDLTQEYELEDSEGFNHINELVKTDENLDVFKGTALTRQNTRNYCVTLNFNQEIIDNPDKSSFHEETLPLKRIDSVQRDAELISEIMPDTELSVLYQKVLKNRKAHNRVDLVTNEIFEGVTEETDSMVISSSSDKIFQEVAEILVKFPKADPNKVYDLLEQIKDESDRIKIVWNKLGNIDSASSDGILKCSSSAKSILRSDPFSDPAFKSNPLYHDLKTLRTILVEKDPNELYAYLEAHYDKPDRVQVVIDELTKSDSQESLLFGREESFEDIGKGKVPVLAEDKMQVDLKELKDIFKDCDPNFLYEKLDHLSNDNNRVQTIAAELFERNDYPKFKDLVASEKKGIIERLNFSLPDFLRKFPNPLAYFGDSERQVSQNYKEHVTVYIKNTYPYLKGGYIRKMLEKHKFHLSPVIQDIDEEIPQIIGTASKKMRAMPREVQLKYPETPDEQFFQEVIFYQHRQHIKDHLEEKTRIRSQKLEAAKEKGELMECGCCFDDECLVEEMVACKDGHIFCKECVKRSSEAAIGDGQTKFLCLSGICEHEFPLTALQELLSPTTFSLALRKIQEEELRKADIPDLVSCPFCSFATIMPNPDDRVFQCLNMECLRDSCRMCKEPNHVPLRCNEVEKQGETNIRTYIETKVSEAMLRICPKCKKRFYKESGCNKMTCICGTTMCYICRTPNIDYDHFNNGTEASKCPIDSNVNELHTVEMRLAAEKAKEEFLRDHPDYDPQVAVSVSGLLNKMMQQFGTEL